MYSTDTEMSDLDALITELAETRSTYEALRASSGPLDERAQLMSRLHALRARAIDSRPTI